MAKKKEYRRSIFLLISIFFLLALLAGCNNQEQKQNQNIKHNKIGFIDKNDITSFKILNVRLEKKDVVNKADRDKIIDLINSVKIIKIRVEPGVGIGYGVEITYSNGEKFQAMYLPVDMSDTMLYSTDDTKAICCEIDRNIMDDLRTYYESIGLTQNKEQDVREMVWNKLSNEVKKEIVGTWKEAALEKVIANKRSMYLKDEKYDGKELYHVVFQTKRDSILGPIGSYIDPETKVIVGGDYRE